MAIAFPEDHALSDEHMENLPCTLLSRALVEGALLAERDWDTYKSDRKDRSIESLTVVAPAGEESTTREIQQGFDEGKIIADAQKALQSIDQTAQSITNLTNNANGLVEGDAKRTLKEAGDAAAELKAAAKDARSMIGKLEGPTSDFAATGLPQLSAAIVTLQSAAESLDRLVADVEQNPRGLVGKAPAKEVEVKP